MIHICDILCMGVSHEKVNSGFVYGLRLAFPDEKIRIYADKTHIDAIVSILKNDCINIGSIEFCPVNITSPSNLFCYPKYYILIKRIFKNVKQSGDNKIFFLSFNSMILHIIKKLKCESSFLDFKFAFVLHGSFEEVAETVKVPTSLPGAASSLSSLKKRLMFYPLSSWPRKMIKFIINRALLGYSNRVIAFYSRFFTLREQLYLHHSIDYRYISLSSHIMDNAQKHIDVMKLNIHMVTMPTLFHPPVKNERNPYPKFAIFGYGNPDILAKVLTSLSRLNLQGSYEVLIIGMNNSGLEGFLNVTTTSSGRRLNRSEMEGYARDVDLFLILHPPKTYELSCSASIFEALSYEKPIIHFDNDCINTYSTKESPIGFCSGSVEEFAENMADIINNYDAFLIDRNYLISNIKKLRDTYSIDNSKEEIFRVFTWPDQNERCN